MRCPVNPKLVRSLWLPARISPKGAKTTSLPASLAPVASLTTEVVARAITLAYSSIATQTAQTIAEVVGVDDFSKDFNDFELLL